MKNELSPAQIASFRENGFVVIPGFLDAAELAAWREAWEDSIRERGQARMPTEVGKEPHLPANSDDSFYGNVFLQTINLWMTNAKMRRLMLDWRLGKMGCDLTGEDGMRIWHDQSLSKRPWDNPTAWHLDNPYWSFTSKNSLSIWVALDDATYENGCLYFLPGTHKLAEHSRNSGIGQNMNEIFKAYPEWKTIKAVAAPMKAGDCSFHNGLCAHGAQANMTPGWRRAMTCAYMPDGSTFNGRQNILSREQVESLKVGDLLEDNKQSPLIYSKSKPGQMVKG